MKKTPMMQQYDRAKKECGDALLLFRMGDFYELFYEDAEIAAKALGMTLTSRDKNTDNPVAMAGFPHHQLDSYLGKLIKLGHRVAVCEQVEDPKTAKGLVKRAISQIVSPGTLTDTSLLEPTECNYLAAVVSPSKKQTAFGVAWLDISTGSFALATVAEAELHDLLTRLQVSELLVTEPTSELLTDSLSKFKVTTRPDWTFAMKHTSDLLLSQLSVLTLDGFGIEPDDANAVRAAGGIVQYIKETQNNTLDHIDSIENHCPSEHVEIDQATWRSLEISQTIRSGTQDGSLFSVINRCVTPMGARQLGTWLTSPLRKINEINSRQDAIAELVEQQTLRSEVRAQLKRVYDLQRLVGRATTGRCLPRDLSAICKTLDALPAVKAKLKVASSAMLQQLEAELDLCSDLKGELQSALSDPCPAQLKDGGYIQDGYNKDLDALRKLAAGGKQWIANYQKTICEQTGIPSLKVGFNKVFGYYLEVTNTHKDKVPDDFIRKQTLKNAERYVTPELKEYEEKVLSADEKALALESELFAGLRTLVQSHTNRLKTTAQIIATLDTIAGLAELATSQSYCRPEITDDHSLMIVEGRHPVLDVIEPTGAFVPNDTAIDEDVGFVHLITGPNMSGKSTYIRQVALITLLAQIGSFVPAKQAKIGIVDRIFARIGASDELSRGQSTFMVEMTETARILNIASSRSLVVLDEIGRGTSTYDGVSLAWSIVEYIHDHIGCRTLFATHYHELTELESTFSGVKNYNVSVQEWDERIVFLHKIIAGAANRSYGIHVAQLAGVPDWVNRRAEQILEQLESKSAGQEESDRTVLANSRSDRPSGMQMTLFEIADHPLIEKIRNLDANQMTPMEALEMLQEWKSEVEKERQLT